jgi:protein-S-isoprenylcysteine O-methyltransferase Ste14
MVSALRIANVLWLAIFILWAVLRFKTKKTVDSWPDVRARLALWGVLFAWFMLFSKPLTERILPTDPAIDYLGLALTILGLSFAAWARVTIGRNWGDLITVQQDHELMRKGPYGIVRHPIYSGFMLATLGTALIRGDSGSLISAALVVICWSYKARLEEAFMIEHFGAEYEQYRQQVKGLIPGVW